MHVKYSLKGFHGAKCTSRQGCLIFWFYSRFQLLGLLVTGSPGLWVHGPLKPAQRALKREGLRGEVKRQSPGAPAPIPLPFPLPAVHASWPLPRWQGSRGLKGRFPFNPKFRKFRLVYKMEQTISGLVRPEYSGPALKVVHFDRCGRTEMSLSIWQNCCPQYRPFVSCLLEQ